MDGGSSLSQNPFDKLVVPSGGTSPAQPGAGTGSPSAAAVPAKGLRE
jgi:hypothetical protein